MSGSFVHKIIIAGCRCFASPLPSGPHQEDADADSKATRSVDASSASLRPCRACDGHDPQSLEQERRLWRGVEVSLAVRKVEKINDRLWTITAEVTTSSFDITTESGMIVRRLPQGRELSRFALARPIGQKDWLLGQASVIQELD
jgi:hypothetical protein